MAGNSSMAKVDEAVILAAGFGKRLRGITGSVPKYFYKIENLPLILYPLSALVRVGVKRIVIVVSEGFLRRAIRILSKYIKALGNVEILFVSNPKPEWGNGYSLLLGSEKVMGEKFLVSMADHIYTYKVPLKIAEEAYNACIVIGGDSKPRFVRVEEATKILAENGILKKIGKNLDTFTHIDVGVMIFTKEAIDIVRKSNVRYEDLSVSKAISIVAESNCRVKVVDVLGEYWIDIDTPRDLVELLYGDSRPVLDTVLKEMSVHDLSR